jgi:hypothetical protein
MAAEAVYSAGECVLTGFVRRILAGLGNKQLLVNGF